MPLSTRRIAILAAVLSGAPAALAQSQDRPTPPAPLPAAQSPQISDTGVKPQPTRPEKPEPKKLSWHGSIFVFDQSVTTQTVGVGADYLSANPVYE